MQHVILYSHIERETCSNCGGDGYQTEYTGAVDFRDGYAHERVVTCQTCDGHGEVDVQYVAVAQNDAGQLVNLTATEYRDWVEGMDEDDPAHVKHREANVGTYAAYWNT